MWINVNLRLKLFDQSEFESGVEELSKKNIMKVKKRKIIANGETSGVKKKEKKNRVFAELSEGKVRVWVERNEEGLTAQDTEILPRGKGRRKN